MPLSPRALISREGRKNEKFLRDLWQMRKRKEIPQILSAVGKDKGSLPLPKLLLPGDKGRRICSPQSTRKERSLGARCYSTVWKTARVKPLFFCSPHIKTPATFRRGRTHSPHNFKWAGLRLLVKCPAHSQTHFLPAAIKQWKLWSGTPVVFREKQNSDFF